MAFLIVVALVFGLADAYSYSQGMDLSEGTREIWRFLFCLMVVLWIDSDSRRRSEINRPFESTYLVFVFLPFYLPYYLIRTWRSMGALALLGFGALYLFGTILSAFIYYIG